MERYLTAASLVTFINNGAIKDVFKILQNHKFRKECIDRVPENMFGTPEERDIMTTYWLTKIWMCA